MKHKIILAILLTIFSGTVFANDDFWWGLGVGALLFSPPVYVAPLPQYYYPPPPVYYEPPPVYYAPRPQEYYHPRTCYKVYVEGYYDYYRGHMPPHTEIQCE
jgi:hypothetical protein